MAISLTDRLLFYGILLRIREPPTPFICLSSTHVVAAFVIVRAVLVSPFAARFKHKRLNRVIADATLRFITSHATAPQIQWNFGTTVDAYKTWSKSRGLKPLVEEAVG